MRIFKNAQFANWALREGLSDEALSLAVSEISQGLVEANLGGSVFKKRIAIDGRGKSGGLRTLLAYVQDHRVIFMFGFAKSQRVNIGPKELKALKKLARQYMGYSDPELALAVKSGILFEVGTGGSK